MEETMPLTITQVDAFTNRPFAGNPAAVCLLPEPRPDAWLQQVAAEMNLSETAFLLRQADGFDLRWFTPLVEVDLCGHATLASAHVLWETGELAAEAEARFHTRSGLLTVRQQGAWLEMNFPAEPARPGEAPPQLLQALGVSPTYLGKNRFDYLVEVKDAATVRSMQPDFSLLRQVDCRGVIVTSRSDDPEYDFISRFFAPAAGIPEDPVTGSAHCCLGPYWGAKLGQTKLNAYQASARGGQVRISLAGERVYLSGQAVTVLRGELL
jgi:PhzF family phenazine biosynthesis protein